MAQLELSIHKEFAAPEAGRITTAGFVLDVALECEAGITVLFGASGSGKTLTLDALAGFLRPAAGRIVLDDAILFDAASGVCLAPQRRHVGYVFQNYALFPHMTVEQNLAFGILKLPAVERTRKIHEVLEQFGIASKAQRRPPELSGGEKQRASIARALITEPKLLLLDEPVRGMDYPLRADFYEILRQVRERHRIPILLVTHDAEEGYLLGDRMAVYEAGRIVQMGTPEKIFHAPSKPSVARLLGIANVFSGTIEALDPMSDCSRLRTPHFSVTVPYLPGRLRGDTVEFCIRREHVALISNSTATIQNAKGIEENRLPVRIVSENLTPTTVRLRLEILPAPGHRPDSGADEAADGGAHLEADVSRQTHQKTQTLQQKDWLAVLPRASIHVFGQVTESV